MVDVKHGDVSYLFDKVKLTPGDILKLIVTTKIDYVRDIKFVTQKIVKVNDEKVFIKIIAEMNSIQLPIWKVIVPGIRDGKVEDTGANYYIVKGEWRNIDSIIIFRGTYGYAGAGCHQSAFVEYVLREIFKFPIKERSGDHLLSLLELW